MKRKRLTGRTPPLSKPEMQVGISLSIENAKRLLNSAEALLAVDAAHAFALYTLAMEEYGKALWLREFERVAKPQKEYPVEEVFKQHEEKLDKAKDVLPQTCVRIAYGVVLRTNIQSSGSQTIWYRPKVDSLGFKRATDKCVSIGAGQTGQFVDITTEDYVADFGARLEAFHVDCFYIGHGGEKQWSPEIAPDVTQLRQAITDFRTHLSNQGIGNCPSH